MGDVKLGIAAAQGHAIEEAQAVDVAVERAPAITADLADAETVRAAGVKAGQIAHRMEIAAVGPVSAA